MNEISVLFFATFRDLAGQRLVKIELQENAHVAELRRKLGEVYPVLAQQVQNALIAINTEYAFDDEVVPDGAEVAIFPPVSGGSDELGSTIIAITEAELDLDDLLSRITYHSTGAACMFAGMVRGETSRTNPHETVYLEYEAYKPMAEQKMHQVADEIRQRWSSVEGIVIVQRIGRLFPRTPTVLIACTAAHRDTGVFDAARYGIDRLKEIVPVWKKEVGPGGEEWVEGEYIPKRTD